MPTKYPDYTCTFADVYLKELDYVVKRRSQMKLSFDKVKNESQRLFDKLSEKPKSVKEIANVVQAGILGILEKFRAWLLVGLLGLLTITTLWPFFQEEISIKWSWLILIFAWFLWFLLLKFQSLFLGVTETPKRSLNIKPSTEAGLVGLALSGGGIRSATFNLGLLQSLAKHKVLQYCDYLSTVSGGGYIGSCLSSLLAKTPQASTQAKAFPLRDEFDGEFGERAEVNYLRKTKNYLGVGGFFNHDTWHMIGTMLSSMMLTITIPLAILLMIVSILYGYNTLGTVVKETIQYLTLFVIILLSVWVVIIRLRQVVFPPFRWPIILVEGLLFLIFIILGLSLVGEIISPQLVSDWREPLDLLAFLVMFLFWWAEIFNLKIADQFTKEMTGRAKIATTIFLESLVVLLFFILIFLVLPLVIIYDETFFYEIFSDERFFYGIFSYETFLGIMFFVGGTAFLCVLVLRIFCNKCFQQVDNLLELEKRISLRAFVVGFFLALLLLLSFIQYLTDTFIETRVIPETTVYVTTPYLFGVFILTLVVGYLLANKANKLIQKSIKMATAIISILLILSFSASLLADILLQSKSVEAIEVINTLVSEQLHSELQKTEIELQKLEKSEQKKDVNSYEQVTYEFKEKTKEIRDKRDELLDRELWIMEQIEDPWEEEVELSQDIENLKQGWEKLRHLVVLFGTKRIEEITTQIWGSDYNSTTQKPNDKPSIQAIPPEYPDFFKLGKLPSWNPLAKCDSQEVNLLIQLKEKVEAEKYWQMQKARTLSIETSKMELLINLITSRNSEPEDSKFLSKEELDKWLEAIYTIAFYQCDKLDLEPDVLQKLNIITKIKESDNREGDNLQWSKIVMLIVLVLVLGLLTNINRNSLHDFYRTRLSRTYIIKRTEDKSQDEPIQQNPFLRLTDLHKHCNGPYHLINTTLNVPTSENPQLKGRGADFFVFSKSYCGSESTGYRSTETYADGEFELATAMAISGAAASPGMGTNTNPIMAFWMTMLNLRLNLWVLNPNLKQKPKMIIWPFYLAKEFFRHGNTKDTLLNLSDGGHHENLGVYPLLKRRCKVIIASDAGADPNFEMADLANLQRKARIDLGININLDVSDLCPPDPENKGYSKAYFVQGTIDYPADENGNKQTGTLFFIKTTMVGDEPEDLLAYRRKNKSFPDETTADQFFYEAQFESYRKLGELAGEQVCSLKTKEKKTEEKKTETEEISLAEYMEKTYSCQKTSD